MNAQNKTDDSTAKPLFDTGHDVFQMRFGDFVVRLSAFLFIGEQSAALHQSKMFRSHVTWNLASLRQFTDRVTSSKQHLNHPQPMGMCQRFEAFCRLSQRIQAGEFR